MTVERIHPKAPIILIFIAIFTCLPSCINLSNNCHKVKLYRLTYVIHYLILKDKTIKNMFVSVPIISYLLKDKMSNMLKVKLKYDFLGRCSELYMYHECIDNNAY